jgi:hypothetical protein
VEVSVSRPCRVDIDFERSVLDTTDVLLRGTEFPGDRQAVLEKRGWDGSAEDGGHSGDEVA